MTFFSSLNYLDVRLFWLINGANTPVLDSFFSVFTNLGNGWVAIPLVVVIVLMKIRRKVFAHTLIVIALSMSAAGILNSQIKSLVGRPRPITYFAERRREAIDAGHNLPEGQGRWSLVPHVVGEHLKRRSLPSGHANTAFSAAMILYMLLGGWWSLGFVVAAGVAYSRVYLGVHFPFDGVVGALLGAAVVEMVFFAYRKWAFDFMASIRRAETP
jgi:undecaprenyl-diphosphatase